jgi:flagellar hook-length control protein FliK
MDTAPAGVDVPENGNIENSSGILGNNKHKVRPGFFAKLLEGLTAKVKNESKTETDNSVANTEKGEKNIKKAGNSVQKGKQPEIFTEESDSIAVLAFFRQESQPDLVKTEAELPISNRKDFLPAEGKLRETNLKNDNRNPHSVHEPEDKQGPKLSFQRSDPSNLSSNRAESRAAEPVLPEPVKAKNYSRPTVELVSVRDTETKVLSNLRIVEQFALPPENPQTSGSSRGKKNRANIEFRDLRTGEHQKVFSENQSVFKDTGVLRFPGMVTEISVNLKLSDGSEAVGNSGAVKTGAGKAGNEVSGNSFESALARELRGDLSLDIVRDATVIARNGGEGTIRLSLRPASLGDVKIRLEMTENKIKGLIVVESNEALRAFQKELPVLEKAFRDSGFSETNLEMSLASDDAGYGWNFGDHQRHEDFNAITSIVAASRYDDGFSSDESVFDPVIQNGMILTAAPERTPVNLLA